MPSTIGKLLGIPGSNKLLTVDNSEGAWLVNQGIQSDNTLKDERVGLGTDRDLVPKYAIELNGSSQYGTIDNLGISGSQNRTVWGWAKRDASTNNSFFNMGHPSTASQRWAVRAVSVSDVLRVEINSNFYESSLVCTVGEWFFWAVVLDGDNLQDHIMYVNGDSESTSSATSATVATTDENYGFGCSNIGGGGLSNYHNGKLFDCGIVNRALSASELEFIRTFGLSGTNPNFDPDSEIYHRWHLDDNSQVIGIDCSGNENYIIWQNSPTVYSDQDIPYSYHNTVGFSTVRNQIPLTLGDYPTGAGLWITSGNSEFTGGQTDRHGGNTAVLLNQPTSGLSDHVYISVNTSLGWGSNSTSPDSIYTASVWVKQGTKNTSTFEIDTNGFAGDRFQLAYNWTSNTTSTSGIKNKGGVTLAHGVAATDGDWVQLFITFRTGTISGAWGSTIFMNRYGDIGTDYRAEFQFEAGSIITEFQAIDDQPIGTLLPVLSTDLTKDINENDADNTGICPWKPEVVEHSALVLASASSQYVTGNVISGDVTDYEISFVVNTTGAAANYVIFGWRDSGTDGFRILTNSSGNLSFQHNSSSPTVSYSINDGADHTVRLVVSGGDRTLYVDEVERYSDTVSGVLNVSTAWRLGANSEATNAPFEGKLSNFEFWTDGTKVVDVPCAEGAGTRVRERVSQTWLDITNAASNWGTMTLGENVNWDEGFSLAWNEALYSDEFGDPTNGDWQTLDMTVTTSGDWQVATEDETTGQHRVRHPILASTSWAVRFVVYTTTATNLHVASDGVGSVEFDFENVTASLSGSYVNASIVEIAPNTYRCEVGGTMGGTNNFINWRHRANGSYTGDASVSYWYREMQIVKGVTDFPSDYPYYPTTDTPLENVRIPASLAADGTDDLGNTLTNPAGPWYNYAESKVNFAPVVEALPPNISVPGDLVLDPYTEGEPTGDVVIGTVKPKYEARFSIQKFRSATNDYLTRFSDAGGTFSDYEADTKAIDEFVQGMQDDGLWSTVLEAYLFLGGSFDGVTEKLKYYGPAGSSLTNNGFAAGDYNATGTLLGLKGDSSSYLETGLLDDAIPVDAGYFASVLTEIDERTYKVLVGVEKNVNDSVYRVGTTGTATELAVANNSTGGGNGGRVENYPDYFPNVLIGDMSDWSDQSVYSNTTAVDTIQSGTNIRVPGGVNDLWLFTLNRSGSPAGTGAFRTPLIIIGKETLSKEQRAKLYVRIKNLCNHFGAGLTF